ncbi:alpha/beta hydrolase [Arthrobacter monumenti]
MSGVDLSAIAALPDGQELSHAAIDMARFGRRFSDTVHDAHRQWANLAGVYQAPEQEMLYAAMDRPKDTAAGLAEVLATAAKALEVFATEVEAIRRARAELQSDFADHEAQTWSPADAASLLTGERRLQDRANALAARLEAAEDDCIRALSRLERSGVDVPVMYSDADRPGGGDVLDAATASHRVAVGTADDPAAAFDRYLGLLAGFSPAQLKTFVGANPAAALAAPPRAAGHDPAVNRQWWRGLDQDMRDLFSKELPSLVGNLEGIDYDTRAAANATALALAASQPFATKKQRDAYQNIKQSLASEARGRGERSLVSFDASSPPLAAVAIGDLDTADHVTFNVPGMGSNTGDMIYWTDASQNIYDRQGALYPEDNQTVVAWVGYDSPDELPSWEVNSMVSAEAGAPRLTSALEGFHTARIADGAMPFTSVTAHSYGTTTASLALTHTSFDLDTVVFYGSAGVNPDVVDESADLHVATDSKGNPEVYATQARRDVVATTGIDLAGLGGTDQRVSPTARAFDAKVFSSEGTENFAQTTGHSALGDGENFFAFWETDAGGGYLDVDTQSLNSIAKVISGHGGLVETTDTDLNHRELEARQEWLRYVR